MKIGIVGNMNNAYFSLGRYLRDAGYDCELLIFSNEPGHFDPSCDTDSDDYLTYSRKLTWGDPASFLSQDFGVVKKDLAPFDFLIGNGPAPAYVARIGRKLDIFMPYGYDLYALPFVRLVHPLRLPAYLTIARYQRKGIKESGHILFDRTNTGFEKIFTRLQCNGRRIVSPLPMIYHKEYEGSWMDDKGPLLNGIDLKKLRAETDLLIVQHARQVWKHPPDKWSAKGNDVLIKGYADYLKSPDAVRSKLVLFEYGTCVPATKKLIGQLGIAGSVVWMEKMPRKDLMQLLSIADLIVGELHHSWLTYGVVLEALCLGKPLMHHRIDAEFSADYPELYPMLHANSNAEVSKGLQYAGRHAGEMAAMGEAGRNWFLDYCVRRPVEATIRVIKEKEAADA